LPVHEQTNIPSRASWRRPVCYDVTRLLTRILNSTPNGIDRVDFALAEHFLSGDPTSTFASTATGLGARLIGGAGASEAVHGIAAHWGETGRAIEDDPVFRRVADWIAGRDPRRPKGDAAAAARRRPTLPVDLRKVLGWTGRHGIPRTRPLYALPNKAAYVNVSQFPLWVASSFEWLEARPDVKAAFFVHDLLPVLLPEYFREAEFERHRKRLRNVARFASAALVTTRAVAADLDAHMVALGRRDMPVFVAPTPISPVFTAPREVDPDLSGHPYFVLCSTIEPRKNHLMVLAVWRALVDRLGADAPKLVLVGTRGWHYDPIVDLIERSPGLKRHVLEVGGLSTPGLKRLIDNAKALLMPTFGEGYGLPVHEALAAGAPVVAADIPVFREIEAPNLTLLSPLAGEAWLETIVGLSDRARVDDPKSYVPEGWATYFARLDAFIDAL
jgi:glycosyltransferase involved in cell wall biosynthesis